MRTSAVPARRVASVGALVLAGAATLARAEAPTDAEIERVLALSDDVAYGEYLAGECAACHSPHGNATTEAGDTVPIIHGAEAAHIARALIEYRAGLRTNTTMGNVAGILRDEEIAVLAHYLSADGG